MSYQTLRQFQPEAVIRFQQNTFCFLQSLAHRSVSCLPEIPAFGMLLMCFSRNQCDAHIRDRRSRQYASVNLFLQMCQDQTLPVAIQHILAADIIEDKSAAGLQRFH